MIRGKRRCSFQRSSNPTVCLCLPTLGLHDTKIPKKQGPKTLWQVLVSITIQSDFQHTILARVHCNPSLAFEVHPSMHGLKMCPPHQEECMMIVLVLSKGKSFLFCPPPATWTWTHDTCPLYPILINSKPECETILGRCELRGSLDPCHVSGTRPGRDPGSEAGRGGSWSMAWVAGFVRDFTLVPGVD